MNTESNLMNSFIALQKHGIPCSLQTPRGKAKKVIIRFSEEAFQSLCKSPHEMAEIIELSKIATAPWESAQSAYDASDVSRAINKLLSKNAARQSTRNELALLYETEEFHELSQDNITRYISNHFYPRIQIDPRDFYIDHFLEQIIRYAANHPICGKLILTHSLQPNRYKTTDFVSDDCTDVDTLRLKKLMAEHIHLQSIEHLHHNNMNYLKRKIEVEFYLLLMTTYPQFTRDLNKAIRTYDESEHRTFAQTLKVPPSFCVYIGYDRAEAYAKWHIY